MGYMVQVLKLGLKYNLDEILLRMFESVLETFNVFEGGLKSVLKVFLTPGEGVKVC